ncbi:MAG: D-alanine--D-alanine ligase [Deltaproteobacteria bacterium]|nr:D-alanine--D-alanine ligase [Deltaproteobacteria bacterium]
MKKIRVGIIFGGRSAEHEVSLQSARNVIAAIDKNKYEVLPIGIDKSGRWLLADQSTPLLNASDPKLIKLNHASSKTVALLPSEGTELISADDSQNLGKVDVVFPLLHGPLGEDGTLQGLLRFVDVPCVGPGVLSSAVCMDKVVTKKLLQHAGIPTPNFLSFKSSEKKSISYQKVKDRLGATVFVKPTNLGSSVGINKASDETSFEKAVEEAFTFDHCIIVETCIVGREIEIAVLGNEDPEVSVPGEIIPNDTFYSYNAKYINADGAKLIAPAVLDPKVEEKIRDLAKQTFTTLACQGMARIDFFVTKHDVYVNEVNTIPGFTNISMYPRLWQKSGLSYEKLIDRLIQLALETHKKDKKLKRSYN